MCQLLTAFCFLLSLQATSQSKDPEQFYQHLRENITFPEQALRMGIDGTMLVEFKADQEGNISDVVVVKGLGQEFDTEIPKQIAAIPDSVVAMLVEKTGRKVFTASILFSLVETSAAPKPAIIDPDMYALRQVIITPPKKSKKKKK
jgi:Gram-negative bacterial TonB protein C-terminal